LAEPAVELALPATPYIIYSGSIAPAGNHETLLMALARLKAQGKPVILALAGEGTDRIAAGDGYRESYLRGLLEHLGLVIGTDLHLLGPLAPGALKSAFSRAAGAVLPALAEDESLAAAGQAWELGLPLACSNQPAMQGYFARRGGDPLWFRPGAADELAAALTRLTEMPHRAPAALPDTSWDEVAGHYLTLFREQSILASTQMERL
jgi:glycosyltransferase involved in cell wall biosynthesis